MRIPIIDDLTTTPIPATSNLLVEFDADSQWYNMSFTLAADWMKKGGTVSYNLTMRSPDKFRSVLGRHGLDVMELERNDKLRIQDYHTATLGRPTAEVHGYKSLKVHDLSVDWARIAHLSESEPETGLLRVWDNLSTLGRFNEEKNWVEFVLSRELLLGVSLGATTLHGIVKGVHEAWIYRRLEDAHDGTIDIKLTEDADQTRDMIRIRTMREVGFDRKWHQLTETENLEIHLAK